MKDIKGIIRFIFRWYMKICTVIGFIFLAGCFAVIAYLLWVDPDFLDIDYCLDQGLVWDYEQRTCRSDCLTWNKTDGCVPITEENRIKKQKGIPY